MPTVELEHLAEIELKHLRVLEEVRNNLLLLLLLVLVEVLLTAAATSSSASEERTKHVVKVHVLMSTSLLTTLLLVLFDALLALLIINASLVSITECLVSVCNLREFLLGSFRVVLVLVRMVLDSELLERFLDFLFCSILLQVKELIVVFALFFFRLLALLLTAASMAPLSSSETRGAIVGIPRCGIHDKSQSQ